MIFGKQVTQKVIHNCCSKISTQERKRKRVHTQTLTPKEKRETHLLTHVHIILELGLRLVYFLHNLHDFKDL